MKKLFYAFLAMYITLFAHTPTIFTQTLPQQIARITIKNNSDKTITLRYYYPGQTEESCNNPIDISQQLQTDTSNCIRRTLTPQLITSFFIYKGNDANNPFPFGLLIFEVLNENGSIKVQKKFSEFFKADQTSFTSKFFVINYHTATDDYSITEQQ